MWLNWAQQCTIKIKGSRRLVACGAAFILLSSCAPPIRRDVPTQSDSSRDVAAVSALTDAATVVIDHVNTNASSQEFVASECARMYAVPAWEVSTHRQIRDLVRVVMYSVVENL